MPLGDMLRETIQQYVIKHDSKTGVWRILNTWHEAIRGLDLEADLPDEHPALTILPGVAFQNLVEEAHRLGVLQNVIQNVYDVETSELTEENKRLLKENEELKKDKARPDFSKLSENFALKSKAMDAITKLAVSDDIVKLSE